jgi:hypothetical protein
MWALSSCLPENQNPIVDAALPISPLIVGHWVEKVSSGNPFVVDVSSETATSVKVDLTFVATAGDNSSNVLDQHSTNDSQPTLEAVHFLAARTRIGDRDIAELTRIDSDQPDRHFPPRFFISYALDGNNRLLIWSTKSWSDPFAEAIREGVLEGRVETVGGEERATITATTANLRKFVKETADLFDATPIIFERLSP